MLSIEDILVIASTLFLARSVTLFLLPSSTIILRQPASITKLVRTIRPYTKAGIAILWVAMRIFYSGHLEKRDGVSHPDKIYFTSGKSQNSGSFTQQLQYYGVLDLVQLYFRVVSEKLVSYARDNTDSVYVEEMVARISFYLNDFLGIVLLVTLVGYCQKLRHYSLEELKNDSVQAMFSFAKNHISAVQNGLLREEEKMEVALRKSLWKHRQHVTKVLPKEGKKIEALLRVSALLVTC